MNSYNQAQAIVRYFQSTRGVGHTFAVLNGATLSDAIVVFANHNQARTMADKLPHNVRLSLTELNTKLYGMNSALMIDNHALSVLLSGLLQEIDERDKKIDKLTQSVHNTIT